MTIEQAKEMLDERYEIACGYDWVKDPLTFALYYVALKSRQDFEKTIETHKEKK